MLELNLRLFKLKSKELFIVTCLIFFVVISQFNCTNNPLETVDDTSDSLPDPVIIAQAVELTDSSDLSLEYIESLKTYKGVIEPLKSRNRWTRINNYTIYANRVDSKPKYFVLKLDTSQIKKDWKIEIIQEVYNIAGPKSVIADIMMDSIVTDSNSIDDDWDGIIDEEDEIGKYTAFYLGPETLLFCYVFGEGHFFRLNVYNQTDVLIFTKKYLMNYSTGLNWVTHYKIENYSDGPLDNQSFQFGEDESRRQTYTFSHWPYLDSSRIELVSPLGGEKYSFELCDSAPASGQYTVYKKDSLNILELSFDYNIISKDTSDNPYLIYTLIFNLCRYDNHYSSDYSYNFFIDNDSPTINIYSPKGDTFSIVSDTCIPMEFRMHDNCENYKTQGDSLTYRIFKFDSVSQSYTNIYTYISETPPYFITLCDLQWNYEGLDTSSNYIGKYFIEIELGDLAGNNVISDPAYFFLNKLLNLYW